MSEDSIDEHSRRLYSGEGPVFPRPGHRRDCSVDSADTGVLAGRIRGFVTLVDGHDHSPMLEDHGTMILVTHVSPDEGLPSSEGPAMIEHLDSGRHVRTGVVCLSAVQGFPPGHFATCASPMAAFCKELPDSCGRARGCSFAGCAPVSRQSGTALVGMNLHTLQQRLLFLQDTASSPPGQCRNRRVLPRESLRMRVSSQVTLRNRDPEEARP